jgi:hypothetical protein
MRSSPQSLLKAIVSTSIAITNCEEANNTEWLEKHRDDLAWLEKQLPSGSGVDCGTKILSATGERVVLTFDFHHMDAHGFYAGWTYYKVIVKPHLLFGFTVKIVGPDRNSVKDYLSELFQHNLKGEVRKDVDGTRVNCEYENLPPVPTV